MTDPHDTDITADQDDIAEATDDELADELESDAQDEPEIEPEPQPEAIESEPVEITAQSVVEAILFASDGPIKGTRVAEILGAGDARDVRKHVDALNESYADAGRAYRIEEIAGGFQMLTLPDYNRWIEKLRKVKAENKLSQAALETLAIIAYRQPVLRADIEAIRGVSVGDMVNRLREMGLVKIAGRAEDVGRPLLYGTTKKFLDVFGLKDLRQLPEVEQLKAPG